MFFECPSNVLGIRRDHTDVLRMFFVAGFVASCFLLLVVSYTLCVLPTKHWNQSIEPDMLKAKAESCNGNKNF